MPPRTSGARRTIRDVRHPDLVRPIDLHIALQIRINLVARRGFRRVRATINGLYSDAIHRRRHMAAAHHVVFPVKKIAQHPRSEAWIDRPYGECRLIRADAVFSACVQERPNRAFKRQSNVGSAGSHPRRASVLSIGSENAYHRREFKVGRGRTHFNR